MLRFTDPIPIIFIVTEAGQLNEISLPYALGFYTVFIAIPTALTQGRNLHTAPICTMTRPF